MSRLTTDFRARVYDDDHGFYAEIRDDADGLGMAELVYSDGDKDAKPKAFALSWEHAAAFAEAILRVVQVRVDHEAANPKPET